MRKEFGGGEDGRDWASVLLCAKEGRKAGKEYERASGWMGREGNSPLTSAQRKEATMYGPKGKEGEVVGCVERGGEVRKDR